MRHIELTSLIIAGFRNNIASCVWGDPGCGKSEFVKNLAKELDHELIHINCYSLESTDLVLPSIEGRGAKKEVEFIPCSWVKQAAYTDKPTIIFLDELNRIKPENLNLLTTLVLEKEVYGIKLSSNIKFIAAGNFESNCLGVNELDSAIYARFMHLLFDLPITDSIPFMGDSKGQEFLMQNLDLLEVEGQESAFSEGVLEKLKANRRSQTFALRMCQDKEMPGHLRMTACQGLLGIEGAKFSSAWETFSASETRKVPPKIEGNEDRLGELLEQGMVAEVAALCQKSWDSGNKDKIDIMAAFVVSFGNPELFRTMIDYTKGAEVTFGAIKISAKRMKTIRLTRNPENVTSNLVMSLVCCHTYLIM